MRLTERDRELLLMLAEARWLSTGQVKRCYFAGSAVEQARRRLRILRQARYVRSTRAHPMAESLHGLGPKGKDLFAGCGFDELKLERTPPKYLEHFLGVTDIRLVVKRSARREGIAVEFFFGFWELGGLGWRYAVVPDAVAGLARRSENVTAVFEYDRGYEPLGMLRKKFRRYAEGLEGFPISRVVVVFDTPERLDRVREETARHIPDCDRFSFLLRETLARSWSAGELFI